MASIKRTVLTIKQRYAIFELLRAHLIPIEGTELVKFEAGWSDRAVASAIGGGINETHVARARREAIGELEKHTGVNDNRARFDRIESAFNALCDKLGEQALKV